ncbi:hypothetical protein [Rhizobium sp. GCM10022189]|jgi:hypothetical protein
MSTLLISLLCNIEAFEHIRAAVCAARDYRRELCDAADGSAASAIPL